MIRNKEMEHKYSMCNVKDESACAGLLDCIVCGGAESSLTKECCERKLIGEEAALISKGVLDFIDGKWVMMDFEKEYILPLHCKEKSYDLRYKNGRHCSHTTLGECIEARIKLGCCGCTQVSCETVPFSDALILGKMQRYGNTLRNRLDEKIYIVAPKHHTRMSNPK